MSVHGLGLRLHHVGMVVADIPASAEKYQQRFGYEARTPVIHDAVQTAYVQFLALAGESMFLELVAPDGPGSKLANALAKGGGLNHLCYRVSDIDAACKALRARGMLLLQAPVAAAAFPGRRIAWLMGDDRTPVELVEEGREGDV
ncbi:MAG TPA: VOC family protein [Vicinamibacterales bacterium]|nr:VOC family protein [Vicinamibacterales bacterium]